MESRSEAAEVEASDGGVVVDAASAAGVGVFEVEAKRIEATDGVAIAALCHVCRGDDDDDAVLPRGAGVRIRDEGEAYERFLRHCCWNSLAVRLLNWRPLDGIILSGLEMSSRKINQSINHQWGLRDSGVRTF